MHRGWIKLWRKISDNDLWLSEPFTRGQAWLDLLILANHKPGFFYCRGIKVLVERGQVGISEPALAERWQWSRGKVRRFLSELDTVQQIVQQKNNVTGLITITNYTSYQSDDTANDTADSTTDGQQTDTNKNDKNVRIKEECARDALPGFTDPNEKEKPEKPKQIPEHFAKTDNERKLSEWCCRQFHRKPTTEWSDKEISRLRQIAKRAEVREEAGLIGKARDAGMEYSRTAIAKLLNNWPEEVDKARAWIGDNAS